MALGWYKPRWRWVGIDPDGAGLVLTQMVLGFLEILSLFGRKLG